MNHTSINLIFLMCFEQTARHIVNERKEEKRICGIFLLSSITAKECSYDKTEKYQEYKQMNGLELLSPNSSKSSEF